MEVTIPPNTTATVYIPARNFRSVTEAGQLAAEVDGVRFLRMEAREAVFKVSSGTYRFISDTARSGAKATPGNAS